MAGPSVGSLKRWSCISKQLPLISKVKALHVYDFDNTLFQTPMANAQLWTPQTMGLLHSEDFFINGGWWHDNHILEATGEGADKEEQRAWEGWWNEDIVRLVEMSIAQDDALTILLTGRGEDRFADIIKRMVASKKLDFDMICLKPRSSPAGQKVGSTMAYKQQLLEELVCAFRDAEEIRVYEDRPKHVTGFREFFGKLNQRIVSGTTPGRREHITAEVIPVPENSRNLDPVVETAQIQRMVNEHNLALQNGNGNGTPRANRLQIKKTVFFTGYMISPAHTAKMQELVHLLPPTGPDASELKYLATNILITPRPATQAVLDKVGGLGAKNMWQVNGVGCHNGAVWAARCAPLPASADYYTEAGGPVVVLAHRRGARPADAQRITAWSPVPPDQQLVFETTVGEKVQLRVEREVEGESAFESLFARERNTNFSAGLTKQRKTTGAAEGQENGQRGNADNRQQGNARYRGGNRNRGTDRRDHPYQQQGDRRRDGGGASGGGGGGGGNNRGGGGGGGRGGQNRAKGRGGYKSLDEAPQPGYAGYRGYDGAGGAYGAQGGAGNGSGAPWDEMAY